MYVHTIVDPAHLGQAMTWRTAAILMMAALQPCSGSSVVIQADGTVCNAQRRIYPAASVVVSTEDPLWMVDLLYIYFMQDLIQENMEVLPPFPPLFNSKSLIYGPGFSSDLLNYRGYRYREVM